MSAIHCLVERNHYDILLEVIKHSLSESLSEEKLSKDKWLQLLDNKKMSFEEKLLKVKELPRPKKLEEIAKYGTKVHICSTCNRAQSSLCNYTHFMHTGFMI